MCFRFLGLGSFFSWRFLDVSWLQPRFPTKIVSWVVVIARGIEDGESWVERVHSSSGNQKGKRALK